MVFGVVEFGFSKPTGQSLTTKVHGSKLNFAFANVEILVKSIMFNSAENIPGCGGFFTCIFPVLIRARAVQAKPAFWHLLRVSTILVIFSISAFSIKLLAPLN